MEDEDPRKFWKRRNPFFGLFEEFDKMDDIMDEMMKNAFRDMESMKGKPMSYGFSMKIGPDGKPKIREFGNVKPTDEKLEVREHREPLVDVIDHEDKVDILAELPGVEKRSGYHAVESPLESIEATSGSPGGGPSQFWPTSQPTESAVYPWRIARTTSRPARPSTRRRPCDPAS